MMMKQEAVLGRGQSHKSHDIKGSGENTHSGPDNQSNIL